MAIASNGESTIVVLGQAGESAAITVTVPGDDNYNNTRFTYTLVISDALSTIDYTVTGQEAPYDGQSHCIQVAVTAPASGAQVRYRDADGHYTLTEPPAYTDVKRADDEGTGAVEGYEVAFQITAPGYETVTHTATLTIQPRDLSQCTVSGIGSSYTYTGEPITTPHAAVTDGSRLLTQGQDYTVTYGVNQNVGEYDSQEGTGGSVTFTGRGNYTGTILKTFEITAVGATSLTAALDRTYGTYGDAASNHAAVTVYHGDPADGGHAVSGEEITVSVSPAAGAAVNGQEITFSQVGHYTITVTVRGNHSGTFTLSYTLLPASGTDGGLTLTVAGRPTPAVSTYGEGVDGAITVRSGDDVLTAGLEYDLTYSYQPFTGTGAVAAGTPYDPEEVFGGIPARGCTWSPPRPRAAIRAPAPSSSWCSKNSWRMI